MARLAVIGAGVVGTATAYELSRAGHQVTLFDRHDGPCKGTSARNGAQLSYAYVDALASPSLLSHLPAIVFGRDPAFRVRLQSDPEFLLWGFKLLLNASPRNFLDNTRYLLGLASASQAAMTELLLRHELRFNYAVAGKMVLYATPEAFASAHAGYQLKTGLGFQQQLLSRADAISVEPALAGYRDTIAGAIYSPEDAVGQPHLFCADLVEMMQDQYGTELRMGHEVSHIDARLGKGARIRISSGEILDFDNAVLCTGETSGVASRFAGYSASWPVQGYSMTVTAQSDAMRVSITDVKRKTVFARIGENIRIAGIADIGRRHPSFDPARFEALRRSASEAFQGCYDVSPEASLEPWTGARPMSPSSRPIIRRHRRTGLYLNLGHGAQGWTLALGSAGLLSSLVRTEYATP